MGCKTLQEAGRDDVGGREWQEREREEGERERGKGVSMSLAPGRSCIEISPFLGWRDGGGESGSQIHKTLEWNVPAALSKSSKGFHT